MPIVSVKLLPAVVPKMGFEIKQPLLPGGIWTDSATFRDRFTLANVTPLICETTL
jgi:hypothetical protein